MQLDHRVVSAAICLASLNWGPTYDQNKSDAASLLAAAISNTRNQSGYLTTFEATLCEGTGSPLRSGTSMWVSPHILFVRYRDPGFDERRVLRIGTQHLWVYDLIAKDWMTGDEMALARAGMGIQNPNDILKAIQKQQEEAKFVSSGDIELRMTGSALKELMGDCGWVSDINVDKSSALVQVILDGDRAIKKCKYQVSATLLRPGATPEFKYAAQFTVHPDKKVDETTFFDDRDLKCALSADMIRKLQFAKEEGTRTKR